MKIRIANCKSIDSAEVEIVEKKLNIKYAMNGTGKSTIAKAIQAFVSGSVDAADLTPFKHRGKPPEELPAPQVSGHEQIQSVAVFNEDYMNQFTFKPDELLSDSYEVFVRTPDYDARMSQIEALTKEIIVTFQASDEVGRLVADFGAFIDSFGKAKIGYSAAGSLVKGIGNGNKIEHIPEGLESYSDYLRSEKKIPWLSWQIKGTEYLEISQSCPFCTHDLQATRSTIDRVKAEFEPKAIEHLNSVLTSIDNLDVYFAEATRSRVRDLCHRPGPLKKEELAYLVEVKNQVQLLRSKLLDLRELSYFSLKDAARVAERLASLTIDLNLIGHLRAEATESLVEKVNQTLTQVSENAGQLQGEVNKQKRAIEKAVVGFSEEINAFLKKAGYRYSVAFELAAGKYRLRLHHSDFAKSLEKGDQFLSFGERNAFALVLFMYESISRGVDLVVLDDPISSFDRNKKFAIIDMLFLGERSLKGRTVLMLTHDFEPIIDMMHTLRKKVSARVVAKFLSEQDGVLQEKPIEKRHIKSIAEVCRENVQAHSEPVVQLIHLRRYYEVVSGRGMPYELISNLLHCREVPIKRVDGEEVSLTGAEIQAATVAIREHVPDFDYKTVLRRISNRAEIKALYEKATSSYEKLQLFRIVTGGERGDDVLRKYINETFHIENDYLMQLNPCEFETTPKYIVEKCDVEMSAMS